MLNILTDHRPARRDAGDIFCRLRAAVFSGPEKKGHRSGPVSYTHLDVYKRQEELAAFTEFFMNRFAGKDGKK